MKTLFRFLFFMTFVSLLTACNKSDMFFDDGSPDVALKCGPFNSHVFVVAPNGTDDTYNLQQAFDDALKAGSGSVVKLVAGEYHLGFLEIREFSGSLIGAGKGKTIITANTGLDIAGLSATGEMAALIKFVGGNVTVRDMTIQTPPEPSGINNEDLDGLLLFSDYNVQYESKSSYIKASVDNVKFIGHIGDIWGWFNCYFGLKAAPDGRIGSNKSKFSNIDMTVTNCTFNTIAWAVNMMAIKKGKLIVGSQHGGNIFNDCSEGACFWGVFDDVEISITGNTFNIPAWCYGSDISNGYTIGPQVETKAPLVKIEDNIYNKTGGEMDPTYTAMWVEDVQNAIHPEVNLPMHVLVRNNLLNLDQSATGMTLAETQNAVVINNKFTGNGYYGIYAFLYWGGPLSENGRITGNNFSKAAFDMAAVYLDANTKNWIVAGNCGGSIDNEGINNVIRGMNLVSVSAKKSVIKSASNGSSNNGPARRKDFNPGSY